jgi:hypothetical protein
VSSDETIRQAVEALRLWQGGNGVFVSSSDKTRLAAELERLLPLAILRPSDLYEAEECVRNEAVSHVGSFPKYNSDGRKRLRDIAARLEAAAIATERFAR